MSILPRSIRVFFFGDSICFGQGIAIHHGWVTRISQRLDELGQEKGCEITVINVSINGNTTRQALERMPYDVQSQDPHVVLVQFGMNDCNHWVSDKGMPRVSPKSFQANLEEIIHRAMNFGAKKILLNTNHATTRTTELMDHTNLSYEESNRRYNALIRQVPNAFKPGQVVLSDMEKAFLDHTKGDTSALQDLLLPDRLHLGLKGHDLYYDNVMPSVLAAVESLLSEPS